MNHFEVKILMVYSWHNSAWLKQRQYKIIGKRQNEATVLGVSNQLLVLPLTSYLVQGTQHVGFSFPFQ